MAEPSSHDNEAKHELVIHQKQSFLGSIWSSFLAGVVVIAPIGITGAIVFWFVTGPMTRLDTFVKNFLPAGDSRVETITRAIPGFGVLVAIIAIILMGAFAKNFIGGAFIRAGENLLDSVPVVRNLYRFFKNVFETALQQSERSFKEVALVEYPRPGAWVMAFVVGETKGEVREKLEDQTHPPQTRTPPTGRPAPHAPTTSETLAEIERSSEDGNRLTSLFIPTVPNPTSGFLLFVPRPALRPLDMSVEEAAKVVFSLGLVMPHSPSAEEAARKLEAAAEVAAALEKKNKKKRWFGGG